MSVCDAVYLLWHVPRYIWCSTDSQASLAAMPSWSLTMKETCMVSGVLCFIVSCLLCAGKMVSVCVVMCSENMLTE